MIGYYIHHQGVGHLNRATTICSRLHLPAIALTSLDVPSSHPFADILSLPRDDIGVETVDPTAHGALHWVPHHDHGLTARMALIARWVEQTRPAAVVVDVSAEVAAFVRLLGVPVIVMAVPGDRTDAPHQFVHQLADHIVAAWPRELYDPSWLHAHLDKTSYIGGISNFAQRARSPSQNDDARLKILVLGGAGGSDVDQATVEATATQCPEFSWKTLGLSGGPTTSDPWPDICAADVVVTHAGQGCVADVAAARRPAIVLPQSRPFDEQDATADALCRHRLATVIRQWPSPQEWEGLIAHARGADADRWELWRTEGAPSRAATAIEATARRCAARG
jgi:predicted glycosyltransferase